MALSSSLIALLVAAVILLVKNVVARYRFNSKFKLPPEIPGWPIIGNTLDVPFPGGVWGHEMAKRHGEMFTCRLGGKVMVFLNSARVVSDLLEKRATIYSSRPYRPMAQDIASGGARMLLMGHTNRWRTQRKIMHAILNGQQAESKFIPFEELEVRQLVWDYLHTPYQFYTANQRFSNSVIMSVIFGRRAQLGDEQLRKMLKLMAEFGELLFSPTKNICDLFTWLNYLPKPLQWWRPYGEDLLQRTLAIYQHEVDALADRVSKGTAKPCFATALLEGTSKKEFDLTETEKLMIFSTLLEAGSDTSRTAITQMVAGAAAFPEWAATARAHLDEVCGYNAERLPSFADRENLPYITAVVKETLRWRPFIQTGVPHQLTQDDAYEGYRFPAGTLFTWNAYALSLNETDYKDAIRFMPERFLDKDLKSPLKGHWSFGTGRRVCVGYNVGANNVWIAAACLLYCFDIEEDPDHPIDTLNSNWDSVDKPPFAVKITPRSQAHVELIKKVGMGAINAD
ncbi:cytochrome P450 [Ilyonectria destructans]|nr:cytochrome P450 [Ilyonectria sp. MPI-CAGE-AT-0026]KAH7018821.1 cytochrome P450 [Ilyonectria destructans]